MKVSELLDQIKKSRFKLVLMIIISKIIIPFLKKIKN